MRREDGARDFRAVQNGDLLQRHRFDLARQFEQAAEAFGGADVFAIRRAEADFDAVDQLRPIRLIRPIFADLPDTADAVREARDEGGNAQCGMCFGQRDALERVGVLFLPVADGVENLLLGGFEAEEGFFGLERRVWLLWLQTEDGRHFGE